MEWGNQSWVCQHLQISDKVHTLQVDSDTPRMGKHVNTDYCCSRNRWIYTSHSEQRTSKLQERAGIVYRRENSDTKPRSGSID